MRVLTYVHHHLELDRITRLMTEKGIPTLAVAVGRPRGPSKWALFVCLNSQWEDAVRLMHDETHAVASPVDVESFNRNSKIRNLRFIAYWSTILLVAMMLILVVIVWLIRHS